MKKLSDLFFNIVYELLLILLLICWLPKFFYSYFKHKKYSGTIFQRMGFGYPVITKGDRPLIWIHAVSVGETRAVTQLVKTLKLRNDKPIILISSITETGHQEAKNSLPGADYHVYLPFDFTFILKPLIRRIKPDMVVFVETDFWYNFMRIAKKNGAKIGVVNGKISSRSLKRYRYLTFFANRLFNKFDFMCVQNNHYRDNFISLAGSSENIVSTGNIKLSNCCHNNSLCDVKKLRCSFGIPVDATVLVFGSTHSSEEQLAVDVFNDLKDKIKDLYIVIVPRHPERFNSVAKLLDDSQISYCRYSEQHGCSENKIMLVDSMGKLQNFYQLADLAIVAGSFVEKVGGHNILEPAYYGVPAIFGPYMSSQPDFLYLALEYGSGAQVDSLGLSDKIYEILTDSVLYKRMSQGGLKLWSKEKGAVERTLEKINFFQKTSCG